MTKRSLEYQLKYGLRYFELNPARRKTKQWTLFVEEVLKPWSAQQLARVGAQDRAEIEKKLEFFGGYLLSLNR